jgi:hypothetical protein
MREDGGQALIRPVGRGYGMVQKGGEQDALTGWRHRYVYLTRAGAKSAIKRRARRRERREGKQETRER